MNRVTKNNLLPDEKRCVAINVIVQNGQSTAISGEVPGALINILEDILTRMDEYLYAKELEYRNRNAEK